MTPHQNRLGETVILRGHNICFHREIRKIMCQLSLLPLITLSSEPHSSLPMKTNTILLTLSPLSILSENIAIGKPKNSMQIDFSNAAARKVIHVSMSLYLLITARQKWHLNKVQKCVLCKNKKHKHINSSPSILAYLAL